MTLLLALAGCVQYDHLETGLVASGSEGCELSIESEGDIKEQDDVAVVEFYARVDGEDCDPGATHDIEMDEWDSGGGLTNPSADSSDSIRTGVPKRYTLACEIEDDQLAGECGCTLRLEGTDEEASVSLVID